MSFLTGYIKKPTREFIARHVCGVITNTLTQEPIASLTFDDGPDPVITPQVLDILKNHGARATFFMVGEAASRHPDIVRRVAHEGHAIGIHSWNHLAFPLISLTERWSQIRRCQRAISPYSEMLLRPPYGMNNTRSNLQVFLQGYRSIGWSLSSEDCYEADPGRMVDEMVRNIKPGDIVLMHDRVFDEGKPTVGPVQVRPVVINREPMLIALRALLEQLDGRMRFVPIPELLRRGEPQRASIGGI